MMGNDAEEKDFFLSRMSYNKQARGMESGGRLKCWALARRVDNSTIVTREKETYISQHDGGWEFVELLVSQLQFS